MSAAPAPRLGAGSRSHAEWAHIGARAPKLASTMSRYLAQSATSLAPGSVVVTDKSLRQLARWLVAHTDVATVADIARADIEDFKAWLGDQPGVKGAGLAANTRRQRLQTLRVFFERIIEWDWPDAPMRNPLFGGDIPPSPEPLPRFLDDATFAIFMRAARAQPRALSRLVVELLARTGMRVGELCGLEHDAVVGIGDGHWLRVPVGKLRNDRYIPLHPTLVTLVGEWTATAVPNGSGLLLVNEEGRPLNRHAVVRMLNRITRAAGIEHVHPHQLRHTLATQAINRGMSLEAVAALLGHRSMDMTLTYARIADRTVANEYFAVSAKVEALYDKPRRLPADAESPAMARLRREHTRMLGNGFCTRPVELGCAFETICETCSYFATTIEFVPVLLRQRDHARKHRQPERAALFDGLIDGAEQLPS
jgi:site-specific recombinase XerD